jgi:cobalt-zinc-cadmium efflux system membrane fusion protein
MPAAPAERPGEVLLSAESQRRGGIRVEPVKFVEIGASILAPGRITVNEQRTWSVGALVGGRVTSVSANVGDIVREGTVLARIHSHDVHEARANRERAQAEVARATAAVEQAGRVRDRMRRLLELKAASRAEAEQAEAALRDARAALKTAQVELEREEIHLSDYLEIKPGPEEEDVPVKAPESGLVVQREITPGSVVVPGQTAFRITDPGYVWMIASANETDLPYLHPGQTVNVRVRAFGDRVFTGKILRLGEALNPETRTLEVRVLVPNQETLLKPEMLATAEIQRSGARKTLLVPSETIQIIDGNSVVFVRAGPERFVARVVREGERRGSTVEITSGLSPGEQVVTKGSFVLKSQMLKSTLEGE